MANVEYPHSAAMPDEVVVPTAALQSAGSECRISHPMPEAADNARVPYNHVKMDENSDMQLLKLVEHHAIRNP